MRTKKEIIKHRFEKSKQTLKDASTLLNDEGYISAVNRMYYALFYAITAFLTSKSEIIKSHKGVNIRFHNYLVSKDLITKEEARLYYELFDRRNEFDYNDFVTYNEKEIEALFKETKSLIDKIESLTTIDE